ncbi:MULTISPECIES: hypothetical protein [unclassified Proteus (in: enterobacteria)]|uniref:fimbrial biogenesis chaperone n=1 Tax=unclassified Proteus (in: enterobacteria) TaxID=257482 RepID=UPI003075E87A
MATKEKLANPWQEKLTLTRKGNQYQVNNPTPYYITLVDAAPSKGQSLSSFEPLMIAPFGNDVLSSRVNELGSSPVLVYVNDYGGRPNLNFRCKQELCVVDANK